METRLIRYLEDSQQTMSYYLSKMQTFGYVYDTLWLPHDAENKTLAAAGRSIDDIVRAAGYKTRIIPRTPIADSLNAARTIFPNCWFDRENCADGLSCLRHYRYEVDPDTQQFSKTPLHDHYSHGADAFRYIGLMVSEPRRAPRRKTAGTFVVQSGWMG
jgi:phage terminase large subunit